MGSVCEEAPLVDDNAALAPNESCLNSIPMEDIQRGLLRTSAGSVLPYSPMAASVHPRHACLNSLSADGNFYEQGLETCELLSAHGDYDTFSEGLMSSPASPAVATSEFSLEPILSALPREHSRPHPSTPGARLREVDNSDAK